MQKKKRLTDLEFMRLTAELGEVRNKQAQQLAYAALVEGRPLVEIGREYGVSSAWVMQCRDEWWNAYLKHHQFPPDWVKATVVAPERELEEFLAKVETLRHDYLARKNRK